MSRDQPRPTIVFGPFEADLQTQELRKNRVRLRLPGQSFQILKMLLDRPGELASREELLKALWPSDTFVMSPVPFTDYPRFEECPTFFRVANSLRLGRRPREGVERCRFIREGH
jgi:Transcriptional regulatory protein, C terminal